MMRPISYNLATFFLVAGISAVNAQTIPVPPPSDPSGEVQEPHPILQSTPSPMPVIPDTVHEVRDAILALRRACANLPNFTHLDSAGRPVPVVDPYAVEADTCEMVSSPSRYIQGYAWVMGIMGGVIALLALGVFVAIGGKLRLAWYGPLNRYRQRHWSNG